MKRRKGVIVRTISSSSGSEGDQTVESSTAGSPRYSTSSPAELVALFQLWSANPASVSIEEFYAKTQSIRRLLTDPKYPPTGDVVKSGVVPILVKMLSLTANPGLIFEAEWALTNIAVTKFAKVVAESGAVPLLAGLLLHQASQVREQAAWCIGNLASDSVELRDELLNVDGIISGM